jgi:cytochrome c oxidase subunit 2
VDSPNQPARGRAATWAKRLGLVGVLSGAVLLSGCSKEELKIGFMPLDSVGATNHTEAYTHLWVGGWIAALLVGLVTWGLMLFCLIAYRRRKHDRGLPVQMGYNMPIEIFYTIVPIILVVGFFGQTVHTLNQTTEDKTPGEQKIEVVGKQWAWDFNYVTEDAYYAGVQANLDGTEKPGKNAPTLYLPANTNLEIELRSRDVIHSFWVPAFLEKRDMIPGQPNTLHLKALKEGEYMGKCAELCGEFHSEMLFNVKVVSMEEFKAQTKQLRDSGNKGQLGDDLDRTEWHKNPYEEGEK